MKTYNWCKKCPNGCCRERVNDTLNMLWHEICGSKEESIMMFGSSALIRLDDLEKIIDKFKEDKIC